ncbi:MAG TPA: hypothetical protein DIU35_16150 [Candidatus Latescibacteria bacterium]|nr:hypothetical protein [Candidatus Latescibacterota bacterium]
MMDSLFLRTRQFRRSMVPKLCVKEHMMGRILVIDDEGPIHELYKQALEKEGYVVVAAKNGQVGIDLHEDEAST